MSTYNTQVTFRQRNTEDELPLRWVDLEAITGEFQRMAYGVDLTVTHHLRFDDFLRFSDGSPIMSGDFVDWQEYDDFVDPAPVRHSKIHKVIRNRGRGARADALIVDAG